MKPLTQPPGEEDSATGGAFYQCNDKIDCGLRFPVGINDTFAHRCPRCRGPVQMVAGVEGADGVAAESLSPSVQPPSNLRLLLDNWRSTFNVGSAFRTADGAGVGHIYLSGISATPDSQRKLAKTALGAEAYV